MQLGEIIKDQKEPSEKIGTMFVTIEQSEGRQFGHLF